MPSAGSYEFFWQENPKLWEQCRAQAKAQMLAAGWSAYAGKFAGVQMRKAVQLWNRRK